jgi:hypothetical protein
MKKTPKKLVLSRETLRLLNAEQIKWAVGDDGKVLNRPQLPATTDSVRYCCA